MKTLNFIGKLEIEDKEFNLVKCELYRMKDNPENLSLPNPACGIIRFVVETPYDPTLLSWMYNSSKLIQGKAFFDQEETPIAGVKELHWQEGYIGYYKESLDIINQEPLQSVFDIHAGSIQLMPTNKENKAS